MDLEVIGYCEGPELWEAAGELMASVWPEYNRHGDVMNAHWGALFDLFPRFQFLLYDAPAGTVAAEGNTAPCPWDGTFAGLGDGIDEMLVRAVRAHAEGIRSTALCATAAKVTPAYQGRGLAGRVLDTMAALAREAGFAHLIAPVRPSLKERYPIIPIERYVRWTRADGQPFDPWIRTHTRRGGKLVKPVPHSLRITGTVGEWESWTGIELPEDGCYTFPRGLAPLDIDRREDVGLYFEPNVWIVHPLGG
ncbi:MAG TPA: hypothetical protein VE992_00475 [Solirubrobacteraceae bacterium]|nr:hypothetical protein [Solirubrobacteraceae bacterium]